jgi:hypothetical protein
MQTKLEKRDFELENLVGNLLIAQYQVERLKKGLAIILAPVTEVRYLKISSNIKITGIGFP